MTDVSVQFVYKIFQIKIKLERDERLSRKTEDRRKKDFGMPDMSIKYEV